MINWVRVALCGMLLVMVSLVLMPVQILCLWLDLKPRRWLPRHWHRVACLLLGLRVRVHGELDRRRPLLLSANHVSWKDILVLSSVADVVFVAKSDVKSWPIFGLLARLQASVFVEREQKRTTGHQVNDIGRRLADGEIVVLFPEGTTSDGNRLLDIKTSLFGAAASAVPQSPTGVVHVQPLAISYTGIHGMPMGRYHRPIAAWPGDIGLVPHLLGVLREGALEVDVDFGEAVDYDRHANRKEVSRLIGQRIRKMLSDRLRGRSRSAAKGEPAPACSAAPDIPSDAQRSRLAP
ncbi:1-acyl-sn-glycerol-3-phosphate acyltransferase [Sinorhizobium meliloti WSM1022]|jgi:1-acyl-sn-glycerol-3-phosphate acyltransferase|uniref:Lyso-ornithine lipid O-acyltransferase n=5 Tax=Sinorhizobium TaxID=28105 RepID=OLSA_RHIME|nr:MULTISPECIES: 1-acyl-sn-glycerol-3-phosphate acyltransferase [Sinorhizobium]Q7APG1.1 RecName: Full=Lyso-ornithine lipid O-acyltransferase; AltName: Full=Ornithine lipid synthesis protein A [Sinorhizobium meliloti 1021]PST29455.1 1-acyl-sn-glycerol-3-phosphate acyltransferase [Mesorhizobium loti]TWA99952.1 lyso-ornithine lipid acyltransferase [Ensifer sp. SEMIA 134]TWB34391.1 lyso-ornithine lipid acyltransferase [Ensifer sp. SEMIA 135]AAF76864.1 putative acyltransferase [Sinorhizobium melilo